MATIKAGTYRFNDVLTVPSAVDVLLEQQINFTCFSSVMNATCYCDTLIRAFLSADNPAGVGRDIFQVAYAVVSADMGGTNVSVGKNYGVYVTNNTSQGYEEGWQIATFGEGIKTITIPTDSEVSPEFYEWFTANAVEVVEHTVSGVWKFKDTTTTPADAYMSIFADVSFMSNGKEYIKLERYAGSTHDDLKYWYSDAEYDLAFETGDGDSYLNDWASEEYKTISFVGEQTVSAEFYNWLTANSTQAMASITHNGEAIATLFAGQTATLKCAGMKMAGDVVVSVAENIGGGGDANIVPLIVGDVGTYDANSPVLVTEAFTGGGTPDAMLNFWGTSIPYFKAKKLVATADILTLASSEELANQLYVDLFGDVIPLCQLKPNRNFTDTSLVISLEGVPAIIWVIATDDFYFTKEAGFEDGGVYIVDAWNLMGAEGEASLTALGIPDKPADGFMPVEVIIPLEDELRVTPKPGVFQDFGGDVYYKKVVVEAPATQRLAVTPTVNKQEFYPDKGKLFEYVSVEGVDLSDLSNLKVPCGIYLDPIPKTEYKLGEWLNTDGSYIAIMYTDGTTGKVNLLNTDVYGWDKVVEAGVGTYTLTVKYKLNNINMQTTYRITVTE